MGSDFVPIMKTGLSFAFEPLFAIKPNPEDKFSRPDFVE
jgi:hypothetical protein